jgi:hypothetical protein
MAYPLIVFVVSTVFALAVLRQYLLRHRPYQLAWVASLASAAGGSLAYVVFLAGDKPELAFRLYYILGALWTAPLLGLGSVLLVARSERAQARARLTVVAVLIGCAVGAVVLLVSPIYPPCPAGTPGSVVGHCGVLQALNGGPGSNPDVYKPGIWTLFLIVLNTFGGVAVVGVALLSAWHLWRRGGSARLVGANALIALGTIVISQAGTMARTGFGVGLFWLTMAVGWVILFGGFLLTFNVQRAVAPAPQGSSAMARP